MKHVQIKVQRNQSLHVSPQVSVDENRPTAERGEHRGGTENNRDFHQTSALSVPLRRMDFDY